MFVRNKNNFYPILRKDFERFLTNILRIGYFYLYNIIMKEIFKPIKDFPNYEISNLGNVKSLGNSKWRKEKIMKSSVWNKGYKMLILCKNGKEKAMQVHRLIATAFIPNPLNKPQVNHIDGNKINNSVSNLEWVTARENTQHAFRLGLMAVPKGESVYCAKLNNEQVLEIRELYKTGKYTQNKLGEMYSVVRQCIGDITTRKTWKHI